MSAYPPCITFTKVLNGEELNPVGWAVAAGEFAHNQGLTEDDCYAITLAVEEILCNMIRHGQKIQQTALLVILKVRLYEKKCILELEDNTKRFNLTTFPPHGIETKTMDAITPGGLGIVLVKAFFDRINHHYKNKHNHLKLEKPIRKLAS